MSKSVIDTFESEMRTRTYDILREVGMEESWTEDLLDSGFIQFSVLRPLIKPPAWFLFCKFVYEHYGNDAKGHDRIWWIGARIASIFVIKHNIKYPSFSKFSSIAKAIGEKYDKDKNVNEITHHFLHEIFEKEGAM